MSLYTAIRKIQETLKHDELPNDLQFWFAAQAEYAGPYPGFYLTIPDRENFEHAPLQKGWVSHSEAMVHLVVIIKRQDVLPTDDVGLRIIRIVNDIHRKIMTANEDETYRNDGDVGFAFEVMAVAYSHEQSEQIATADMVSKISQYMP